MSAHFTPEIIAAINLQGDLMVKFMEMGLTEEKARTLAEEAMHLVLTSQVVRPTTHETYKAALTP